MKCKIKIKKKCLLSWKLKINKEKTHDIHLLTQIDSQNNIELKLLFIKVQANESSSFQASKKNKCYVKSERVRKRGLHNNIHSDVYVCVFFS